MKLNDPSCPLCGMEETVHAEYPDPKGTDAEFVCMVCGHRFNDNLYGEPRRKPVAVRPELSGLIGVKVLANCSVRDEK